MSEPRDSSNSGSTVANPEVLMDVREANAKYLLPAEQQVPKGYKQTEVGVIPEDWESSRLQDIFWFQEGPGLRNWQFKPSGLKVINVTNLLGNGYLDLSKTERHISWDEFDKLYKHFLIDDGDVVVASSGNSYCKTAVIRPGDLPLLMNTSVIRFKARKGIDRSYMLIYLKSKYFKDQIDLMITGGAQPNFGPAHLNRVLVPLPPTKAEQEAIAEALSDADALIEALEQLVVKKRQLKQGAMQELLTGKRRLPGFSGEWDVTTLGNLASEPMQNGLFFEPIRKGAGARIINVGDLYTSAPIGIENLEQFNASSSEKQNFRVLSGDLFFTRSSIVPSGIAFCNIFETSDQNETVFDSHLIRLRVNKDIALPRYIYWASFTRSVRKYLIGTAKTATMTTIDQAALKKCSILLPSQAEQTAIAQILTDMDAEITELERKLAKARAVKQGMMQQLLTGKIRLVVNPKPIIDN